MLYLHQWIRAFDCGAWRLKKLSQCLEDIIIQCGIASGVLLESTFVVEDMIGLRGCGVLIELIHCVYSVVIQAMSMYVSILINGKVVKFHPNNNYIATGSGDKTVRLWDVQKAGCVRLFKGHTSGVSALDFYPKIVILSHLTAPSRFCETQNNVQLMGGPYSYACNINNSQKALLLHKIAEVSLHGTTKFWAPEMN
jgi:hypothetical protein